MIKIDSFLKFFDEFSCMKNCIRGKNIKFSFYDEILFDIVDEGMKLPSEFEWSLDNVRQTSYYMWAKWGDLSVIATPDAYTIHNSYICIRGTKYNYANIKKDIIDVLNYKRTLVGLSCEDRYTVMSTKKLFAKK